MSVLIVVYIDILLMLTQRYIKANNRKDITHDIPRVRQGVLMVKESGVIVSNRPKFG